MAWYPDGPNQIDAYSLFHEEVDKQYIFSVMAEISGIFAERTTDQFP
jgi:hypothetical protein